jgi:hypothetical protein
MSDPINQQSEEALKRLRELLQALMESNAAFLQSNDRMADLPALLDQRDLTLELLREQEAAFFAGLPPEAREARPARLIDWLEAATRRGEIPASHWEELVRVAKEFDTQNRNIDAFLDQEKHRLSRDLKTVRKGSAGLKGYAPPTGSESCFIDKIK